MTEPPSVPYAQILLRDSTSNRRKPNKFLFMFVLMLYPIMPLNYYVGPLSYANFCGLLLVLFFFVFRLRNFDAKVFKEDWTVWLYLAVYTIFNFVTASFMNGVAWLFAELLACVAIIFSIEDRRDFFRAIDGIICAAVLLGMLGIAESLTGQYFLQGALMNPADGSTGLRYGVLRCTGTFGSPINLGLFEAIASVLVAYRLTTRVSKAGKRALMLAYVPLVVSMILSVSRLGICVFVAANSILLLCSGAGKVLSVIAELCLGLCVLVLGSDALGFDLSLFSKAFSDFASAVLSMLAGTAQSQNSSVVGFGNRFDLYAWVIDYVGDNWLAGLGVKAEFSHVLNQWTTKTSVEVNYLYIYLQCGVIGLIALIVFYCGNLRYAWRHRGCRIEGEGQFTFGGIAFIVFALYYIAQFGVQETDLARLHFELIALLIAYVIISRNERGLAPFAERSTASDA